METPGLSDLQPKVGDLPPLPHDVPALRLTLPERDIAAVSPAFAGLTGVAAESLLGQPLADFWYPPEREAIERRFDDVVLLGHDMFGALALSPAGTPVAWVEVDATYVYRGGQRLEVELRPIERLREEADPSAAEADPTAAEALLSVVAVPTAAEVDPTVDVSVAAEAAELTAPEPDWTARPPIAVNRVVERATAEADTAPLPVEPEGGTKVLVMAALEASGAVALAVTADGIVASATPGAESVLGRPIARLHGTSFDDLFVLSEAAAEALTAARAGRSRQSVLADLADGEGRVVLEWVPAHEPGAGFGILTTDAPESEASERQRLQARLVSFVAHDVRESLAAVYCGLRTMDDELAAGAPQRLTLERVLAESSRANRIVDDVLSVSRPGRLVRVELELADVLRETMDRHRSRARANGVEVREEYSPGVRVSADLSSLERAFGNLIENALQATPHYGTLAITTRLEGRIRPGVRISIADTGVGVKPDIRPNVFEPFVTGKSGGTGLGLAITRRVVLDHEGQIDFESEEGRGTTFHVWLPVAG